MIVKDFVVIGGGIAGISAIKAIREELKTASVLWISDEDRMPYKRTKINKSIVSGFSKEEFALIDHDWLVDNHIELLFDKVEFIDAENNELSFQHRGHLKYNKLILATGNCPNPLNISGASDYEVYDVRTARQVENIIRSTSKSKKYLVVGAGVEGVETAEQLANMGKEVILVDRNSRVLKRYFNEEYSGLMQDAIQRAGVRLVLNVQQIKIVEKENEKSVVNIDKEEYSFDTIISTVGYSPNIKLAQEANVTCNVGVLVNEYLQTSDGDIYAAGDVAEHPESIVTGLWHAAEHQGRIAGLNACGKKMKLEIKPFRMKTEVFGEFYFSALSTSNNLEVVTEIEEKKRRKMYFKDDKLDGVLMKDDGARAKLYQKALMEKWSLDQIKVHIPF